MSAKDGPVVVVGDALLDRDIDGRAERLCPDAPVPVVEEASESARPGGAALAAVLAATSIDRPVVLVTALGADPPGRMLAELLARHAVEVIDVGLRGPTPEKVRVRADGRSVVRVDRGGQPAPIGPLTAAAATAIRGAGSALVSDYGRGLTRQGDLRAELTELAARRPMVWDPHPRGAVPVPGVRLATPNRSEAAGFVTEVAGESLASHTARARALVERWVAGGVAITMGERGALLASGDVPPLVVPAVAVQGDPCGAGDRFAATAAVALACGALPSQAVAAAVLSASEFVAAGGAGSVLAPEVPEPPAPVPPLVGADDVVAQVRARRGTVVAAGGCFDLLHAGHVSLLQSARSLGDCLVVTLNSDESVRRLKGPGRPLVNQGDRAAVLMALGCVDAVVVFEEDTPEGALNRLRPDVFVKGADYAIADLPEAALLAQWGGQAVVVPFLDGRSTSRLLARLVGSEAG